ncbi:transcriptional regulator PpsR [Chenggangzhangella methanolivorans]|uniref:Transcriptional regulator PpsR n=1 Tax=Chenggangzhangella methanolivorans TaxID=1437009 RepID=A0A9E6R9A1_9HYPH|nr:transcriptional regulator PpsR [Chenggangzhangella methanolivorans]QZO00464.1 transcriptional regulator PpsR [Chenggangzhangella methanolivorans]
MQPLVAEDLIAGFAKVDEWFAGLEPAAAARMVSSAADIALVLDGDGVVRDVSYTANDPAPRDMEDWVGRRWTEIVTIESRPKVEALLRDAGPVGPTRGREINLTSPGETSMPVRFSAMLLPKDGRVLALGRDLRAVASLQQKLVETQLMLDREYSRIRNAETRYRLLFQLSTEAVLIVDDATERVAEANAAAAKIIGDPSQRIVGRSFHDLFDARSAANLRRLIATARTLGHADSLRIGLAGAASELVASASVFRQEAATYLLVRLAPAADGAAAVEAGHRSQALDAVMRMPDGFVVVDERQRILDANPAFLALIELVSLDALKGARLDSWLGRPGVEAQLLIANLREHGSLRDFSTILRGEFGSIEQVDVTGVAAGNAGAPCYGLVIRPVRRRPATPSSAAPGEGFRSVEQLTELVGRVSLKELVRESTDLVEKLCIEAALRRTDDNRASAAQILGLSRQSLYSKLRRHGLARDDESPDDT